MVRQKTDLKIHEEISILQKKLSETDIQLTEEKKTQVRLTNEAGTKRKELDAVLAAIEQEESSFASDVKAMAHDTKVIDQENKDRMKSLTARKIELEHHISAMDTIERENNYLREQILALTRDYDMTLSRQEEEREKIKQRNFDSRMTMERVLRKEIQTLDTNFKVLAIHSMNDEALLASSENQGLYTELSRREDLSRSMISEQQNSYEELQRITIEHEVMITAADYYESVISQLGRAVKKLESKEKSLLNHNERLQETVQIYESISREKLGQSRGLQDLAEQHSTLLKKTTRCRADAIKMCQRALQQSIDRACEQQRQSSKVLSQDEATREELQRQATEEAREELESINELLLTKSRSHQSLPLDESSAPAPPPSAAGDRPCAVNYEAMWQSSKVQFPQLTGSIRTALLSDDKHKHKHALSPQGKRRNRLLLPKGVSASMTSHI